ncbi:MAG: signaling protein, partial [Planctomycetota bacterium]|nr:signaling protein [Planctomycetota bacterium]
PGANAVFVNNYNRRLRLVGLHVFGAGASAVAFVGDPAAVRNPVFRYGGQKLSTLDLTPGPQSDNYPMDCVVEDCLFHEIGTVEKQGAGVQVSMSRRITVRHCSIYDTSRAGININEGTWGGHLIEGCDVFNTVQETGDHGSFNSWGRDRFWLPRSGLAQTVAAVAANPKLPFLDAMEKNIIRDSRWRCDHGWDIDLDDGSSNYDIYNNLMLRGGLKFREGYRRIGTNNIIVGNSFYPSVWYPHSNDVFAHNIVMGAYKPAFMYDNWDGELDRNLFTTSHKDRVMFAAHGADANSMVGDPQFADPAKGDFTVRNEALAKAIGFKNFPMNRFGVQKPALKAIAKTPAMPNPVIKPDLTPAAAPAVKAGAVVWLGATLGEPRGETLSAYGVAFAFSGKPNSRIPTQTTPGQFGARASRLTLQLLRG